jgi:hypothetical protein
MGGLLHHCHCGYLRALDHLHHASSQMLAVLMTRFVSERLRLLGMHRQSIILYVSFMHPVRHDE